METVTSNVDPADLAEFQRRLGGTPAPTPRPVDPADVAAFQARLGTPPSAPKPPSDLSSFGAQPGGEYPSLQDADTQERIRKYGPMAMGVGAGFLLPGSGPVTAGLTSMGVGEGVRALEHKLAGSDWFDALYQGATDTSRVPGTSIRVPSVAADAVAPAAIMGGIKGGGAVLRRLFGEADPMMSRVADTGYESPPEMPKYGEAPGTQYRDVELKPLMGPPREPMGPPRPPEPGVPWTPPAEPDVPPWTPLPETPKFPPGEAVPWTPRQEPDIPPWTPPGPGRDDWPGQVPYTPPPGFPGPAKAPPEPGVPWTPRRIDEITPAPVSPAGRFGTRLEDILQPQLAQREAQLAAQAEAAQLAAAQARQATYIGVPGGHEPTILDEIADVANRTRVTGGAEQIAAITKRAANNAGYPPETPSGMAEPDLRPRTIERSVPLGRSRFGDEEIPEGRTILEPIETETSSRYLGRTREPGGRDYTVAPEGGIGELPKEIVESQKQSWRSGVGYLLKSADDRLREVGQRLLAYNSTAPRLTSTSLPIAERALGRMSTEEQDAVRRYITGELPDAPAHIAEAGEAIKAGVLAPIAKRSVESGRTIIRDGKVVPWEPIAENYAPEFQAAEDTLTSRQATRGGNRSGLLLSRSRKGGVETPRPDFLNVLHEYIPRQNKEIAMAENFGPLTSANPEAPYGVWTQNLLRDANEAGTDRLGVQIASKALREAYEPLLADPSLKWQRRIPARAYLAWNWLTQPRQLATAPINFGLANTIEGNARLIDPGYRRMILGSGGAVPSRGKFLEKAFDVMPESWAGKLSEATDRLNRIVTGAGAGPFIEDLESAAQKGPLNEWHARQAAEAGLNEEQLRRGLTQGEVQSAVARLVQRKQLNPSGAGERIGMLQSPGERNVSGYLDYSTGQHRLSVEDYFKPSVGILRPGQGGGLQLENRLSTAVGGLGRLGRTALYGLPVEAAMMLAADAARGRLMNPNAQPRTGQDVVTRLLESHVPLAGAAARALLPGPRQDAVSAPLASSLSDLVSMKPESIVDILMALDTMAGEPAGPFSQALTMGAEPVKNLIRAQRQAR